MECQVAFIMMDIDHYTYKTGKKYMILWKEG